MIATLEEDAVVSDFDKLEVGRLAPDAAVAKLIDHAVRMGASDLFLTTGAQNTLVRMRHQGIISPLTRLGLDLGKRAIGHIKASAAMEFSEKRRPMDGRLIFVSTAHRNIDCRIAVMPTLHGEDVAIRLLSRDTGYFSLKNLGMTTGQLEAYEELIQSPSGLILITGPTGSGKTSTLYSSLGSLNTGMLKINTIEDPIEFAFDGLHQSQVNPGIELGFAELLRSVLRQNPDVIMIGEIRDEKTAQLAVQAAGMGILVFATLHAQGTAGAVQAMRSLGCHAHFLSAVLRCVVAQRLVRTLCTSCRRPIEIAEAPKIFEEVQPLLDEGQEALPYRQGQCDKCNQTGFSGRTGVFEIMPISKSLRRTIAAAGPVGEIRDQAIESGMLTFRQAALVKVARGQTTTEEIFRVISSEELLLEE